MSESRVEFEPLNIHLTNHHHDKYATFDISDDQVIRVWVEEQKCSLHNNTHLIGSHKSYMIWNEGKTIQVR